MLKEVHKIEPDSDAQGNLVRAELDTIVYERPATDPLDAGATALVEILHGDLENPLTVLNNVSLDADAVWRPRADVHGSDGNAIAGQVGRHALAESRVKITVTGGGAAPKSGTFFVIFSQGR